MCLIWKKITQPMQVQLTQKASLLKHCTLAGSSFRTTSCYNADGMANRFFKKWIFQSNELFRFPSHQHKSSCIFILCCFKQKKNYYKYLLPTCYGADMYTIKQCTYQHHKCKFYISYKWSESFSSEYLIVWTIKGIIM